MVQTFPFACGVLSSEYFGEPLLAGQLLPWGQFLTVSYQLEPRKAKSPDRLPPGGPTVSQTSSCSGSSSEPARAAISPTRDGMGLPGARQRVPVQKAFEKPALRLQTVQGPFPNSKERISCLFWQLSRRGSVYIWGLKPPSQLLPPPSLWFGLVWFSDGGFQGWEHPQGSPPDL